MMRTTNSKQIISISSFIERSINSTILLRMHVVCYLVDEIITLHFATIWWTRSEHCILPLVVDNFSALVQNSTTFEFLYDTDKRLLSYGTQH
jgi:hypothetical protein